MEFCCSTQKGFYVECRSTSPGQGTYYIRYKSNGKTCHSKIGRTTEIDLSEARRRARTLQAEIELGSNPRAEAKARKAVPTYTDFFENYYLPYVKPRKRSWIRDEQLYRIYLKVPIGHKRVTEITQRETQQLHTGLLAGGLAPATCNHVLKLLRSSLNICIRLDIGLEVNVAKGVKHFFEDNKLENHLDDVQLASLLAVLRTDANRPICTIALYLLSTGARLNEALQATWSQIDIANATWRIPASNSKSKRVRSVPLNDSAIEILKKADVDGKGEYVFCNPRTKKPYVTVHKAWARIRAKAKVPQLRLHDLRHQYASCLVSAGRTLYEVQKILGHSDPKVTMRYSHISSKSLLSAANTASDMIKGASQVQQVPKVLQVSQVPQASPLPQVPV